MRFASSIVAALIVATGMTGCSLSMARGPDTEGINCTTNPAPAFVDTVMSVAASIAAALVFNEVANDTCEGECSPAAGYAVIFLGVPSTLLAVGYAGSAVAGFSRTGDCRDYIRAEPARRERLRAARERAKALADQRAEQERIEREPIERARAEQERIHRNNRDQAFGLKKTAADAARSGDCTTAINLGEQIHSLDVDVWHGWFLRDVAIKGCLDAAAAAQPVTPGAQPAPPLTPLEQPSP